jgi:hypothetical protein
MLIFALNLLPNFLMNFVLIVERLGNLQLVLYITSWQIPDAYSKRQRNETV